MARPSEYIDRPAWVRREKTEWSPTVKTILGFILGLLVLSPAILGVYWEVFLR